MEVGDRLGPSLEYGAGCAGHSAVPWSTLGPTNVLPYNPFSDLGTTMA